MFMDDSASGKCESVEFRHAQGTTRTGKKCAKIDHIGIAHIHCLLKHVVLVQDSTAEAELKCNTGSKKKRNIENQDSQQTMRKKHARFHDDGGDSDLVTFVASAPVSSAMVSSTIDLVVSELPSSLASSFSVSRPISESVPLAIGKDDSKSTQQQQQQQLLSLYDRPDLEAITRAIVNQTDAVSVPEPSVSSKSRDMRTLVSPARDMRTGIQCDAKSAKSVSLSVADCDSQNGCLDVGFVPPSRIPALGEQKAMQDATKKFLIDNGLGDLVSVLVEKGQSRLHCCARCVHTHLRALFFVF